MTRSTQTFTPKRLVAAGIGVAVMVIATACGADPAATSDDTPAAESSERAGFPVTVTTGTGTGSGPTEITIEARPEAIISLSPTATETLWAIGAGDQVIAVDDQSDFPTDVPTTDLSGHQPNVEAILGYGPDLVVAAGDTNNLVAALDQAGVPTLVLPAATDLDDAYSQMERLGAVTGHVAEAAGLVADTRQAIADATAGVADAPELTYFHELDPSLYTVTSATFIGQLYAEFGFTSIADEAGTGDDYPQVSSEYVVAADPDLIVLADSQFGEVTVDNVAQRPGWAGLTAVTGGHVVELDPDIASRWGPRIADFAQLIGEQAAVLAPAAAG